MNDYEAVPSNAWCEKTLRGCRMAPQLPSIWHPLEGPGMYLLSIYAFAKIHKIGLEIQLFF